MGCLWHTPQVAQLYLFIIAGWFEISVCLTEELMSELKASQRHSGTNSQETFNHTQSLDNNMFEAFEMQPSEWNNEYDGDDDDDDDSHDESDDDDDGIECLGSSPKDLQDHNIEELHHIDAPPERRNNVINLFHNGDDIIDNQGEALHPIEEGGIGNHSNLESFKADVVMLLNLLLSEKFGHPFGTIAGCVA